MGDLDRPSLILVTESYPWPLAHEVTFIEPELRRLVESFDVTVLPIHGGGGPAHSMPAGARALPPPTGSPWWARASAAARALTWSAAAAEMVSGRVPKDARSVGRLIRHAMRARLVARSIAAAIRQSGSRAPVLVYSYWLGPGTTGACLVRDRAREPIASVVSRAHGYDLFREQSPRGYQPMRHWVMDRLDAVFSISEAGSAYLREQFPELADRVETMPIGTPDPGFVAVPSLGEGRRIVSVAACVPVKRVDVLVDVVSEVARLAPGVPLEWNHLGDGPEWAALREQATTTLAGRVEVDLPGAVDNTHVMRRYAERGGDVFVSVSSSEGRPVAIMEAQSVGIPVVATDVGGVAELVDDSGGVTVPLSSSPSEVAAQIVDLLRASRSQRISRHVASRRRWEAESHEAEVHARFTERLVELLDRLR